MLTDRMIHYSAKCSLIGLIHYSTKCSLTGLIHYSAKWNDLVKSHNECRCPSTQIIHLTQVNCISKIIKSLSTKTQIQIKSKVKRISELKNEHFCKEFMFITTTELVFNTEFIVIKYFNIIQCNKISLT